MEKQLLIDTCYLLALFKHCVLTDLTFLSPRAAICCLSGGTWRLSSHFIILQGTLQPFNILQTLFWRLLKSRSWFLDSFLC